MHFARLGKVLEATPLTLVFLVGFVFFAVYSVLKGGPIFASDEYVYFISGKFVERLADVHILDPGLQNISNLLFFREVNVAAHLFLDKFLGGFRLVHAFEYLFAGKLLYSAASELIPKRYAILGLTAFLLLPSHIYVYAVMPEVELVLITALITYVLIKHYSSHPTIAAAGAGALVGVAILVKPHAFAILTAVVATLIVHNALSRRAGWPKKLTAEVGAFFAVCYVTVLLIWGLMTAQITLNPTGALGLSFYGQYLDSSVPSVGPLTKLAYACMYFVANSIIALVLFSPVFVWFVDSLIQRIKRGADEAEPNAMDFLFVLFACCMLGSHLLMTGWFTAGAAILNSGEAMRLHGRYIGPAFALLPFLSLYTFRQLSEIGRKISLITSVVALAVLWLVILKFFKLYPWDNPLLFSFFNASNWYGWSYASIPLNMGTVLVSVFFAGLICCFIWKRHQLAIFVVMLIGVLVVGCLQNYAWLQVHLNGNKELSSKAAALAGMMGYQEAGQGLVISQERYGRESYLLFNLGNAPKVIDRPEGTIITSKEIQGYAWLITDGNYNVESVAKPYVEMGTLRYYPLTPLAPIKVQQPAMHLPLGEKPILSPGEKIDLTIADLQTGASLKGFNQAEPWGAWTAKPEASIELPSKVKGKLKISLFAWTLDQNLAGGVQLSLGGQKKELKLSDAGNSYELDIEAPAFSDSLDISSSVFQPAGSSRLLGVAIARVSIENIKD